MRKVGKEKERGKEKKQRRERERGTESRIWLWSSLVSRIGA
jgi:hypothetical protein